MRVFTEIQRLPRWVYLIIAPSFVLTVFMLVKSYTNAADAEKDTLLVVFLIVIFVEALAILFVASIKQTLRVDASGLYYTYPPFKIKEVHIPTLNITHYDLVTYTTPYYGYRIGLWNILRKNPSITMVGIRKAVRFTFRDGNTLIIGTRNPDALLSTLHYITKRQE